PEIGERVRGLERENHPDEHRCDHDDRDRAHTDLIELRDEEVAFERSAEELLNRLHSQIGDLAHVHERLLDLCSRASQNDRFTHWPKILRNSLRIVFASLSLCFFSRSSAGTCGRSSPMAGRSSLTDGGNGLSRQLGGGISPLPA